MITYTVEVDDRSLMLHLNQLPMALKTKLRPVITALTNELLARVRSMEPRRTGRLQNLTRAYVDVTEDRVRGRVRILGGGQAHNIAAAALEYGAHRSFTVRTSQRRGSVISAYQRHAHIPARRFLRAPAAAMRARAMAEIRSAVDEAIQTIQ